MQLMFKFLANAFLRGARDSVFTIGPERGTISYSTDNDREAILIDGELVSAGRTRVQLTFTGQGLKPSSILESADELSQPKGALYTGYHTSSATNREPNDSNSIQFGDLCISEASNSKRCTASQTGHGTLS
jgi:hypothetical protein